MRKNINADSLNIEITKSRADFQCGIPHTKYRDIRKYRDRILTIGFGLIFLLFLGIPDLAQSGSRLAEITYIEGKVEVQNPGQDWKEAAIGMQLYKNDKVRTDEESVAELKLDDGSMVKLEEETTIDILALEEVGPEKEKVSLFNLILGEIKAKVLKIFGKQSKFEVQTSACIAGVRGTDFSVSAEGDEAAGVEIYEGSVVVEGINEKGERGAPLEVRPDFCTRIEKGRAPLPAQKIEAYRRTKWQLWDKKKKLFDMAKDMEKVKIRAEELKTKYSLARTDEERKAIEQEAKKLKLIAIKLATDINKDRKDLVKDKEKFEKEIAKAIEKWKSLTPEQRAKVRTNYEIWRKIAPRLVQIRKEKLKEALIRWKNLPPEARQRIIQTHKFWKNLPPGQRKVILLKIRQFKQLPPWVQKKATENYRKWKTLPPGQRKKIIEGYKKWHNLSPEARENTKDRIERFRQLSPDKKKQILHFYNEWRKIPPGMRNQWMKNYRDKHRGKPGIVPPPRNK